MKAAFFNQTGGVEVLQYGDQPDPVCGANDVLIRVRSTSMDRVDIYSREGSHGMRWPLPYIGGLDISGSIVEIGSAARIEYPNLKVGDAVLAIGSRSHAQLALARAALTFPLPPNLDADAAGAMPMASRTAYEALQRVRIQAGETVLVFAGASGVGSYGIQVARASGCRVITTVGSEEKKAKALALGAHAAIDHYKEDIGKRVAELTEGAGVHVVLDHVGTPVWDAAFDALRPFGRFITVGVTSGHRVNLHLGKMFVKGIEVCGIGRPGTAKMRTSMLGVLSLVELGLLKPEIHARFALPEIAQAHQLMESSNFFGKILLTVPQ